MKKLLIVVDMQNDFINGTLGTKEAESIVTATAEKIKNFDGDIFATLDTHFENYLQTSEGKNLPVPHCIKGTDGWELNSTILAELEKKGYQKIEKNTFGSTDLPKLINEKYDASDITIELIGLCTDICVVSNALLLKASFTETPIAVDSLCCAGVTPETHTAALKVMESCQISIK